ncbi:hypothetical protein PASE110613_09250 [Paenibacillus sediminis]|uniref:Uncharacterized protein n=1 Tax=Paenibacillus sediminis TaxID=664909 RepID=A0ABS4H7E3_9BACL|nr:hypothetical protein [Paenibacillus sediminis]MBP1938167.1 hypothetical protein [Paenibacillus sediminis]
MNEQITVLKDESLGGVLREYREVKRKATVGERIKIVAAWSTEGMYDNGAILTVDSEECGRIYVSAVKAFGNSSGYISAKEYVVLEPTEILVIDGERYRMVDRKATVGERVVIINARIGYGYENGDIYTIVSIDPNGDRNIQPDGTQNSEIFIDPDEYRVLEPVESAPLSSRSSTDQIAENIATLAARVSTLEETVSKIAIQLRVAREDIVLIEEGVADDIARLNKCMAQKSPQQLRDEIVERAKADVSNPYNFAGTPIPGDPDGISFWPEGSPCKMHDVSYVVNREKRAVVALIRCTSDGFTVRGIAKCAPDDVFNAHIGRAIALRRALGLEVPAEYMSVPQPEEVNVGDIVRISGNSMRGFCHHYDSGDIGRVNRHDSSVGYAVIGGLCTKDIRRSKHGYQQGVDDADYVIIDDSREEVSAQ